MSVVSAMSTMSANTKYDIINRTVHFVSKQVSAKSANCLKLNLAHCAKGVSLFPMLGCSACVRNVVIEDSRRA